jgi:saccharopine dehydrogenase-like NADP-dependent oxidoreductase
MHRVLLLGAGKIGRMIARLLTDSRDYAVTVGDVSDEARARVEQRLGVPTRPVNVETPGELAAALADCDTVISALSFYHNPRVAEA